jgi:hypothetical protein
MRPLGLVQTSCAGIKAAIGAPAAADQMPFSSALMAPNVQRPWLEGTQSREKYLRGCRCGCDPGAAIGPRFQGKRKSPKPVKAAAGQVFGKLSGLANFESPKGPDQTTGFRTKLTGAAL